MPSGDKRRVRGRGLAHGLAIAGGMMTLGVVSGWLTGLLLPEMPRHDCVPSDAIPDVGVLLGSIARRNTIVYLLIVAGVVTGGALTVAVLFSNGVGLGLTMTIAHAQGCLGPGIVVTMPHGLFELMGFLIGGTIGLRGYSILASWLDEKGHVRLTICDELAGWTVWGGLALVLVGAVVEATITRSLLVGLVDAQ